MSLIGMIDLDINAICHKCSILLKNQLQEANLAQVNRMTSNSVMLVHWYNLRLLQCKRSIKENNKFLTI